MKKNSHRKPVYITTPIVLGLCSIIFLLVLIFIYMLLKKEQVLGDSISLTKGTSWHRFGTIYPKTSTDGNYQYPVSSPTPNGGNSPVFPSAIPSSSPVTPTQSTVHESNTQSGSQLIPTPTATNSQADTTSPDPAISQEIIHYITQQVNNSEQIITPTQGAMVHLNTTPTSEADLSKLKITLSSQNNTPMVHVIKADGTEITLDSQALDEINRLLLEEDSPIIQSNGTNKFSIIKDTTEAKTTFPVSLDLQTNTITMTTVTGDKTITALPDKAVKNALATNAITAIGATSPLEPLFHPGVTTGEKQIITLDAINGDPVFMVNGTIRKKLFSTFPVAINKTILISGDTGEVIKTNEDFTNVLLDLLSSQ